MSLSFPGCHPNLTHHDALVEKLDAAAEAGDDAASDAVWTQIQENHAARAQMVREALALVASLGIHPDRVHGTYIEECDRLGIGWG